MNLCISRNKFNVHYVGFTLVEFNLLTMQNMTLVYGIPHLDCIVLYLFCQHTHTGCFKNLGHILTMNISETIKDIKTLLVNSESL